MKLDQFEKKIYTFIKTYKIFNKYDKILIAVSGGKDSMALMYSLKKISVITNYKLGVLHFNHGIREESIQEYQFVEAEAKRLQLDFFGSNGNVLEESRKSKKSIEEIARKLRYQFFLETLRNNDYNCIALAHQMEDLAETVIYRMTRGTGIYGLGGLLPVNESLRRPMLSVTTMEVLDYVTRNNVKYVTDKTNFSLVYSRNKIRHKILPVLEEINDSYVNNVLKMSEIIWEYREQVEKEYKDRVKKNKMGYYFCLKKDFFDAEILRLFFLKNNFFPPNYVETKKIINMRGGGVRVISGLVIKKKKNILNVEVSNLKGGSNFARR